LIAIGKKPKIELIGEYNSSEECIEAEIFYIEYFKSLSFRLVNLATGGNGRPGFVVSQTTKEKISLANKGRVISIRHREILSRAHKGAKRPPRNKDFSIKMALAQGGAPFKDQNGRVYHIQGDADRAHGLPKRTASKILRGVPVSNKYKVSFEYINGKPLKKTRIAFITDQNGNVYRTIKEASQILGISKTGIGRVLRGKQPATNGMTFRYL
jgi:hypothetical protein